MGLFGMVLPAIKMLSDQMRLFQAHQEASSTATEIVLNVKVGTITIYPRLDYISAFDRTKVSNML